MILKIADSHFSGSLARFFFVFNKICSLVEKEQSPKILFEVRTLNPQSIELSLPGEPGETVPQPVSDITVSALLRNPALAYSR